jgi:hypothetical protein
MINENDRRLFCPGKDTAMVIIVVNLFCSSFLLVKGKKNLTCTAYHWGTFIMQSLWSECIK